MKRPSLNHSPNKENNSKLITTQNVNKLLGATSNITITFATKPLRNHQINITTPHTNITNRKIDPFMTLAQAEKANSDELRNEIYKACLAKLPPNQLIPLVCALVKKPDSLPEDIQYLNNCIKWCKTNNEHSQAIECYEVLLDHITLNKEERILILASIIALSSNLDRILYYFDELLKVVPKGSRLEAEVLLADAIQMSDYLDNHHTAVIHNCKLILDHAEATIDEKNEALELILECIPCIQNLKYSLELADYFFHHNLTKLAEPALNKILSIAPLDLVIKFNTKQKLICVHCANKNWEKVVHLCNELLLLETINEGKIKLHTFLAMAYNNLNKQNSMFKCYETILELCQLNSEKIDSLFDLANSCIQNNTNQKAIECFERILAFPDSEKKDRDYARKQLSVLYLKINNLDKAVEYYKEVIKSVNIDEKMLNCFLKHPNINLNKILNKFQTSNSQFINKLRLILAYNPGLWYGDYKLTDPQWHNILNSDYNEDTIFDLIFSNYLIIKEKETKHNVYLNKSLLLNNNYPTNWNTLTQIDSPITEEIWQDPSGSLTKLFRQLCQTDDITNVESFVNKCIAYHDTENKNLVLKRIISVINTLNEYFSQLNTNNTESSQFITKIIQGAIDIMSNGGERCSDGAAVALYDVENYLKAFKNPQFKANIFINMFKLDCIKEKLTDRNQGEQLETYLYYATKFNSLLGLNLSDETMLYSEHAKIIPSEEALLLLSEFFTAENLIDFTMKSHLFKMIFELDKTLTQKINKLKSDYVDICDIEDENEQNKKGQLILDEIDLIENTFYKQKAIEMYLESKLILSINNYI